MTRFQIERVDTGESWEVVVKSDRFFLGRSSNVEVQLAHTSISRKHLLVELKQGVYHFVDLCSTNGTLVNDTRRREGPLADGDVLQLGVFSVRFRVDPATTHAANRPSSESRESPTKPRRDDARGPTKFPHRARSRPRQSPRIVWTAVVVFALLLACVALGVLLGQFGSVLD